MKLAIAVLVLSFGLASSGARSETIRVEISRDTWLSNVGREADGSNGGAARLKVKSHQELSLIDIDPAPLRGRVIRRARLHVTRSSPAILLRVSVGTVAAEWVEGTASNYDEQKGSSTFRRRRHPDVPWTVETSDLCSVILGNGGTIWHSSDASAPDAEGRQTIEVDPAIVAARVAGISHGFVIFDDTGSEWTRQGETFTAIPMPNRLFFSKDSNRKSAPWFELELGESDEIPPGEPTDIRSDAADLPAGETWVSWSAPAATKGADVLGYDVEVDGEPIPRYLIPRAHGSSGRILMHLRDLSTAGRARASISVRAVDAVGNRSRAATSMIDLSTAPPAKLPGIDPSFDTTDAPLPRLANAEIAIVDELDKYDPSSKRWIPSLPEKYLSANHLWNAKSRSIDLYAAKNEFTSFQLVILGNPDVDPSLDLRFSDPGIDVELGRYEDVSASRGPLPDPIVPVGLPRSKREGPRSNSLHVELFVGRTTRAGEHLAKLSLKSAGELLELNVRLHVWDFTLPDHLSFLPEMNCYGLPANERDYYRAAHRHRTYLNRVPYSQRGEVAEGCAPLVKEGSIDWTAWDRRFGPLFDGTAFADLPRAGVPIEGFYLPIHENWPTPIEPNYRGGYWADRAFPDSYRASLVETSRKFAEHLGEKRWNATMFQLFLNGKNDFKRNGWSRGSSPWVLDEPSSFQDFWALRWFGSAFREGIDAAGSDARVLFRADISRPQWQRDTLDGLLDYNVTSSAFRSYRRIVLDRKRSDRQFLIEYGSANSIEASNIQPVAWSIDAWSLGTDGVLPWQTIGTAESWKRADTLSLFYPSRGPGHEPIPSVRLKAFRRGQQDVEYLTWLVKISGLPRWAIARAVREHSALRGERRSTGFAGEDAGVLEYDQMTTQQLWTLRVRVGAWISERRPAPIAKLVDLWSPRSPSIGASK
ncbi:MAG: DUF4091 domain-containing protein [Isosphaeraceae bacterium]|nr:DUF4091 domain-containing protein [Isosphaeraceae bacterium]